MSSPTPSSPDLPTKDEIQAPSPDEIRHGTVTKPEVPDNFRGGQGWWCCENCAATTFLEQRVSVWTCRECHARNYTVPKKECPAEKLRRYLLHLDQKWQTQQKQSTERQGWFW